MCGIIGLYSNKPVCADILEGLLQLQHRGQDAAGVLTFNETTKAFKVKRGSGLVKQIFLRPEDYRDIVEGNIGLGHVRYATNGSSSDLDNAQPFKTRYPYGIAMVHNGNLTNYEELKKELFEKNRTLCSSGSDLECLLQIFSNKLAKLDKQNDFFENVCAAVQEVYKRAKGGYSVIAIIAGQGMIAFRDPHGIRPLVMGERKDKNGRIDRIFSSEPNMYYSLGFERVGDVGNGEVVFIDNDNKLHRKVIENKEFTPDAFEYIYFARPDAIINDISVYRSRLRMGQNLAKKWRHNFPNLVPDVIIPVPFSSNTAALAMASELGIRYTEGLYKNSFVGRTFIMPNQKSRKTSITQKLSPQVYEIRKKRVLIVDDSIVRGNTSKEVVKIVRDAGAKEIYFASACPPLFYPDFYGIAIPTQQELIASRMNEKDLQKFLKVDALIFQDIEGLQEAILRKGKHNAKNLSMPYFDGNYVTKDIDMYQFKKITPKDFSNKLSWDKYDQPE